MQEIVTYFLLLLHYILIVSYFYFFQLQHPTFTIFLIKAFYIKTPVILYHCSSNLILIRTLNFIKTIRLQFKKCFVYGSHCYNL